MITRPPLLDNPRSGLPAWGGRIAAGPRVAPQPGLSSRPRRRERVQEPNTFYRRYGKRAVDVILGVPLFFIALPFMAMVAIAVLLTSGWPILYRAERLGCRGRPLRMLKFRTMIRNADAALFELLSSDPALAAEYRKNLKLRRDPRTTRLGGILRRLSIDELPQLWQVITGEMSLVGPRPYAVAERDLINPHLEVLECVPGVTGPWQVRGRNALPPEVRVALDVEYAGHYGPIRDLEYLLATVRCLIHPNGR